jgi:hypothetical protein
MSIQRTVVEVANQAFARQNKETTVSTIDLIKMIQDGEKQLEGLYDRIKQGERQALLMEDRIQAQKDTIGRLQAEVLKLKTKRK